MNTSKPTTPLFQYDTSKSNNSTDKRFITTSPTKSLQLPNNIDEQEKIRQLLPRDNTTNTSLATAAESFQSAHSYQGTINLQSLPNTNPFHILSKPTSLTPNINQYSINSPNYQDGEDLTPKISNQFNNQLIDTIKQQHIASTENLGLGIIKKKKDPPLIQTNTKPINAIRASKIINHKPNSYNIDSKKRTTREIYNSDDTGNSFILEDTIDTIGSDDNDIQAIDKTYDSSNLEEITNYTYLFIVAIHAFDVNDLDNENDMEICLSFNKNDIAFVHNVDQSGWGEVTLINNLQRGWVPFNYFADIIDSLRPKTPTSSSKSIEYWEELIHSKIPLQKLLFSSAKFLINPKAHQLKNHDLTFDIKDINSIRDGVKSLLEMTEAVSRSNEIVRTSEPVKKIRKKLLADWYNLMIKADYYKDTTSNMNISNLIKLVFEVLRKAFTFYDVWSENKIKLEKNKLSEMNERTIEEEKQPQTYTIKYLPEPPYALERLNEISDILFTYSSLILGRLDMIEHNPTGCETLELMVHQIIILLRELLYISKSCSQIMQQKYNSDYENVLDKHLDPLLALVSELVSCIKILVTQTLQDELIRNANDSTKKYDELIVQDQIYHYSNEGKRLIKIVSKMTTLISNTLNGCNNYLRVISNFRLGSKREYPDFDSIKITTHEFIKRCSEGLTKSLDKDKIRKSIIGSGNLNISKKYDKLIRFSSIRAGFNEECTGNNNDLSITPQGSHFLNEFLNNDTKAFSRESTFDKFKLDDEEWSTNTNTINNKELISNELLFDNRNNLIGASFRAMVYKLTDELDKPELLFTATVLLNYRKFAKPVDLVTELINRFDIEDTSSQFEQAGRNGNYSSRASRLKNRRKLVCKVFHAWMESYWDHYNDYKLLPTITNFFNEAVVNYLPIEAKKLIILSSQLFADIPFVQIENKNTDPQNEINDLYKDHWNTNESSTTMRQLVPKSTSRSKTSSIISNGSSSSAKTASSFSLDERIIEEYGLTNIQDAENNLMSLPLPVLNLGTTTLLTKDNTYTIQSLMSKYLSITNPITTTNIEKEEHGSSLANKIGNWEHLNRTNGSIPLEEINKNIRAISFNLTDLNPLEIAKQITLIESYLFNSIQQFEMVNHRNLDVCPHVALVMTFTNQLSNYVMESLVDISISLEQRIRRLNTWLRIALSVLYFRNFNSLASIMTSLQNHAVSRVKSLWASLNEKDMKLFKYLARIVYPNHNYKVYRDKLKQIMEDTQFLQPSLPTVPFFNIFLQDLIFVEDGNPDFRNPDSFRPNKLVNIDKYFRITKIINSVEFLQIDYEDGPENNVYLPSTDNFDKRDSFFHLTDQLTMETNYITPVPELQELILSEFWRTNEYYKNNRERAYELSLKLVPRNMD